MDMNKFTSKQVEAANYTVVGRESERQQIARHVAEFERRLTKESRGRKGLGDFPLLVRDWRAL